MDNCTIFPVSQGWKEKREGDGGDGVLEKLKRHNQMQLVNFALDPDSNIPTIKDISETILHIWM